MKKIVIATDVALNAQTNGVATTLNYTKFELEKLGYQLGVIDPTHLPLLTKWRPYPDVILASTGPIARMLDESALDALHIPVEGPVGWAARRWAIKNKVPYSSAYHTQWPQYLKKMFGLPETFTWMAMRRFHGTAHAVMVNSEGMKAQLIAQGITNLVDHGRGVDYELFRPRDKSALAHLPRPIILSVGRVSVEKGLEDFLAAPTPGTKVVVGDGPARAALQAKYPEAVFLGAKFGEELARCYDSADAFAFPSKTDTFGLVNVEALACGVPVVAYTGEPGPELIASKALPGREVMVLDRDFARGLATLLSGIAAGRYRPEDCRAVAVQHFGWAEPTRQFLDAVHWRKPAPGL